MIKIPRSQQSQIKDVLYPDTKKPTKDFQKKNRASIKKVEEQNRLKKFEKENYVAPKPYKMKEFEKIPSKLYTQTQQWVNNEKNLTKETYKEKEPTYQAPKRPLSAAQRPQRPKTAKEATREANMGMFEKYYYDKLYKNTKCFDDQHFEDDSEAIREKLENDQQRIVNNIQNIEEKMNEEYEMIKKAKLKGETPVRSDAPMILPKSEKNFINENKALIHDKKVPLKMHQKKEIKDEPYHKNYGKTPQYIKEMKIEAEVRKEILRRKKEEAKHPKGTRLLSEEERVATLNGLYESQKEIMGLIERLPISMRTMAVQKRKDELEEKLDEIEEAIKTFSRKQVFIKDDS